VSDPVVGPAETSVWIGINGVRHRFVSCSPHRLDAVAIGQLAGDGCIRSMHDVIGIEPVDGPGRAHGVNVAIDAALAAQAEALHVHRREHGCHLRHELDCAPARLRAHERDTDPPDLDLADAFRALFAAAEAASPSGGLHACALLRENRIEYIDTDVARHSAVDRVIGLAVQDAADLRAYGLLLSARLSGAMALKAAVAGLGWIASRSIATSLAAEIAHAARMPVLQRAARRTSAP
jgi:FdhD protein